MTMCWLLTTQHNNKTRQLFTIFDRKVAELIRKSKVLYKFELERCLLLNQTERRRRMKNDILNEIWTLWVHYYVIWTKKCAYDLSMID